MLIKGFEGHKMMASALRNCFDHATSRRCFRSALESHADDRIARAAFDEVRLELEFARGCANARSHAIIRHRNDLRAHSQRCRYLRGYIGKLRAFAQTLRAVEMRCQISIAQLEPCLRPLSRPSASRHRKLSPRIPQPRFGSDKPAKV